MARYLAGIVSVLLLIVGAVLFWQGRGNEAQAVPMPPPPQAGLAVGMAAGPKPAAARRS